jgi:hypothetical protein
MEKIKSRITLFLAAFIQMGLVAIQTFIISHNYVILAAIVGGFIAYLWTHNVKRAAMGNELDRIIYSFGAFCGILVGLIIFNQYIHIRI